MGVISDIISKMEYREYEKQELLDACKKGYVSIFYHDRGTSVLFSYNGVIYNRSSGSFSEPNILEIHHKHICAPDIIHVTLQELIDHGAKVEGDIK